MSPPANPHLSLRGFWSELPTPGRWLLSTVVFQLVGRGLTLPFTIIYLHEVRGFSLGLSGALMAVIAVVALLVTGPGGVLVDRWGPRTVIIAGSAIQLVGVAILAFALTPTTALIGLVLMGINGGVGWPAFNAFVAAIVHGPLRQQYFGINFALVNLGIGIGGIIGGIYADVNRPVTFTVIYLLDAVSMLIPLAILLGPLRHVHGRSERPHDAPSGSYLAILRKPVMAWMALIGLVTSFVGYGQMEAGFPAFARQGSGVSTAVIGYAFAVNTAVIVAAQFPVLRLIAGRRRTRVMLGLAGCWALAWLTLGLTPAVAGTTLAAGGVIAFHVLFAIGETMLQPTIPAIVNDLADDYDRGRFNAVSAGAFQIGAIAAPVVSGVLLQHHARTAFIAMNLIGIAAVAVMAMAVERHLSPAVNGVQQGH